MSQAEGLAANACRSPILILSVHDKRVSVLLECRDFVPQWPAIIAYPSLSSPLPTNRGSAQRDAIKAQRQIAGSFSMSLRQLAVDSGLQRLCHGWELCVLVQLDRHLLHLLKN